MYLESDLTLRVNFHVIGFNSSDSMIPSIGVKLSTKTATCLIWNTPANPIGYAISGEDLLKVDSSRAGGKYCINVVGRAVKEISKLDDREKARLTTWLVEQRRLGDACPEIQSLEIESITTRPQLSVHARADELLKYVQKKTSYIGEDYGFTASNPPMDMLAYTESVEEDELQYLFRYLFSQGWLELTVHETHTQNMKVVITVKGYGRLAVLETVVVPTSKAFVAMWFHKSLDFLYPNAIEPAIKDAGYDPLMINKEHFLDKIDDQIIAEIKRSRFVVADFTHGDCGARGSVYYEAGFAQGLGKDVIFTCRKDIVENNEIHFDLRQYPYVLWEKNALEQFRTDLTFRIARVIGDGPLKAVLE